MSSSTGLNDNVAYAEEDIYVQQAHKLVDFVIESALKKLEYTRLDRESTIESLKLDVSRQPTVIFDAPSREDFKMQDIEWLRIRDFSVEAAEQKILEFINTWKYQDSWKFCVDYLGVQEFDYDFRHRFRVMWSIPTRRKPIPRSTASVYFTFEVSKIKPEDYPVEVYYVFETHRLVHRPGKSRFREKWLKDIIECKVSLMSRIDF